MKIGVLTFFRLANYGANLQALSTYCFLRNSGHEVLFIDWTPDDFYQSKVETVINDKRCRHHFAFVDEILPKSRRCVNDEDICSVIDEEKIDAVIIGSDAVLQNHPLIERVYFPTRRIITITPPGSTTSFPNPFWGSFIDKLSHPIPVAVMSGSSQDSFYFFIRGRERKEMGKNINKFSYISVRDTWTQKMIQFLTHGKVKPDVTPDPVFALRVNAKELIPSKKEISLKYGLPEKYVLFSFWNNKIVSYDWLKNIGELFERDGIIPVAFPMPGGVRFQHPFNIVVDTPTPIEWYSIIVNATAYIGEKMHPIVACLSNAVPCYNFDHCGVKLFRNNIRYSKSSKIFHIMNEFGAGGNRIDGHEAKKSLPAPEKVYNKIQSFDKDKCRAQSDEYVRRYNDMMSKILEKINNK